jgi:hypothetical protein
MRRAPPERRLSPHLPHSLLIGVKRWRTDRDGEIIVTTDGVSLTASARRIHFP